METVTLSLTHMAHGGSAIARKKPYSTIFVPLGIPGERVRAQIVSKKNKHAQAEIVELLDASPERVQPRCAHFGICGGCHFQHIDYHAQLRIKRNVVVDQLARIGKIKNAPVAEMLPNPQPYAWQVEMVLSPVGNGRLGYWSPFLREIIPISECPISHPELVTLLEDIDLDLPGLRKLALRIGDDEALLAAVEVDNVEAPELAADFPVSAAIVLPNRTAANLVGDNYTVQQVLGRDFRVSPGCYLAPSPAAMGQIVETVLGYAALTGEEQVLELYSGVGAITAFLAHRAAQVTAVEQNPDAVEDMAFNLDEFDNVAVYADSVEAALPQLETAVDLLVAHPPAQGFSRKALQQITEKRPSRIITVSGDVATLARDGRQLARAGYQLAAVQPIDMQPQTFHIETVSLWKK